MTLTSTTMRWRPWVPWHAYLKDQSPFRPRIDRNTHSAYPTIRFLAMPATQNSHEDDIQQIMRLKGPGKTWLEQQLPLYISLPKDYGSKSEWSKARALEYAQHFELEAKTLSDGTTVDPFQGKTISNKPATMYLLEEAIKQWFRNAMKAERKHQTSQPTVNAAVKGLLKLTSSKVTPFTAKDMFAVEQSEDIKTDMRSRMQGAGVEGDTRLNLKYWHEALSAAWEKIGSEDRAEYQDRADKRTKQDNEQPDEAEIFKNQDILANALIMLFQSLSGHGKDQVGDIVYHLQYAFRGSSNTIMLQTLSGGTGVMIESDEIQDTPNYNEQVLKPFTDWANHRLKVAKTLNGDAPDLVHITVGIDGHAGLPDIDLDDATNKEITRLLVEYFDYEWSRSLPENIEDLPIPWGDVEASPSQYLNTSDLPNGMIFRHPKKLGSRGQDLYRFISGDNSVRLRIVYPQLRSPSPVAGPSQLRPLTPPAPTTSPSPTAPSVPSNSSVPTAPSIEGGKKGSGTQKRGFEGQEGGKGPKPKRPKASKIDAPIAAIPTSGRSLRTRPPKTGTEAPAKDANSSSITNPDDKSGESSRGGRTGRGGKRGRGGRR